MSEEKTIHEWVSKLPLSHILLFFKEFYEQYDISKESDEVVSSRLYQDYQDCIWILDWHLTKHGDEFWSKVYRWDYQKGDPSELPPIPEEESKTEFTEVNIDLSKNNEYDEEFIKNMCNKIVKNTHREPTHQTEHEIESYESTSLTDLITLSERYKALVENLYREARRNPMCGDEVIKMVQEFNEKEGVE